MQCKARFDEIEVERKAKHEINSISLGRRVRFFDESVVYMIQDLHRKFVKCFRLRKNLKSFVEDKISIFKQDEDAETKDDDEEEEEKEDEKNEIPSARMYVCKMMQKYVTDLVKFEISSSSRNQQSLRLLLDEYYLKALRNYAFMHCGAQQDFFRQNKRVEQRNDFKPYFKDGT